MVFVSLPSEMRSAVHIAQIAGHWDETIHQQGFVVQHVPEETTDDQGEEMTNKDQQGHWSQGRCRKQHMSVLVWEKWVAKSC